MRVGDLVIYNLDDKNKGKQCEIVSLDTDNFAWVSFNDGLAHCGVMTSELRHLQEGEVIQLLHNNTDSVDHPSHYNSGKIEVIDYIQDQNLGFSLGNSVKYISRAGKKDKLKEVEDLEKAIWYINKRIEEINGQN